MASTKDLKPMAIYRYFENMAGPRFGLNYTEDRSKAAIWLIQGKPVRVFDHSTDDWKPVKLGYEIIQE